MTKRQLIELIVRARAAVVRPQGLSEDERLDLIEALPIRHRHSELGDDDR